MMKGIKSYIKPKGCTIRERGKHGGLYKIRLSDYRCNEAEKKEIKQWIKSVRGKRFKTCKVY